jgi:hypothetical protein
VGRGDQGGKISGLVFYFTLCMSAGIRVMTNE